MKLEAKAINVVFAVLAPEYPNIVGKGGCTTQLRLFDTYLMPMVSNPKVFRENLVIQFYLQYCNYLVSVSVLLESCTNKK